MTTSTRGMSASISHRFLHILFYHTLLGVSTSFLILQNNVKTTRIHSSTTASSSLHRVTKWLNGRRCLFISARNPTNRNEVSFIFDPSFCSTGENINGKEEKSASSSSSPAATSLPLPPIVILGGMAQSIPSWEHHLPSLSKDRDIFVYEYLGSGLGYRHPENSIDKHQVTEVRVV